MNDYLAEVLSRRFTITDLGRWALAAQPILTDPLPQCVVCGKTFTYRSRLYCGRTCESRAYWQRRKAR